MLRRLRKRATASSIVANSILFVFSEARLLLPSIFGAVTVTLVIYRKNLWLLFWSAIGADGAVLWDFQTISPVERRIVWVHA